MARSNLFGDADHNPSTGELVRYAPGSTALAIVSEHHAGGWHGLQCMGGYTFFIATQAASDVDKRTWVACATWRGETEEEAAAAVGFNMDDAIAETRSLHSKAFVDTPQPDAGESNNDGPVPGYWSDDEWDALEAKSADRARRLELAGAVFWLSLLIIGTAIGAVIGFVAGRLIT